MANKGYKFRLYPTLEQERYLARCFGCSRFVYNHFLRLITDAYAESKKHLKYADTAKLLTLLKKDEQYSWLTEVNSQSLQQTLKDLESAFSRFFKRTGSFPVFKKKRNRQSFRIPQHWSITPDGMLKLPKMQPIKMVQHREMEGSKSSVTISKTSTGKYYASILLETEGENPTSSTEGNNPDRRAPARQCRALTPPPPGSSRAPARPRRRTPGPAP